MKITIAQLNPIVGDVERNLKKMVDALEWGSRDGSDLVVLPELFLSGYPPRDLLERPWFILENSACAEPLGESGCLSFLIYQHSEMLYFLIRQKGVRSDP